jgi:hypothetical protein
MMLYLLRHHLTSLRSHHITLTATPLFSLLVRVSPLSSASSRPAAHCKDADQLLNYQHQDSEFIMGLFAEYLVFHVITGHHL